MPQPLSGGPPHAATRPPLAAPVAADGQRNEVVLRTDKVPVGSEGEGVCADDDDSTGSSISFTSKYMEEQQHLEATGRSVSVVYTNHCKEQGVPYSLSSLLAMATGELNAEESATEIINDYVLKSWLALSAVRVTAKQLKEELVRRYDIACAVEDTRPKKPRVSGTIPKLTEQLERTGAHPLQYVSERRYIIQEIKYIIKTIADEQKENNEMKMQRGEHIFHPRF